MKLGGPPTLILKTTLRGPPTLLLKTTLGGLPPLTQHNNQYLCSCYFFVSINVKINLSSVNKSENIYRLRYYFAQTLVLNIKTNILVSYWLVWWLIGKASDRGVQISRFDSPLSQRSGLHSLNKFQAQVASDVTKHLIDCIEHLLFGAVFKRQLLRGWMGQINM